MKLRITEIVRKMPAMHEKAWTDADTAGVNSNAVAVARSGPAPCSDVGAEVLDAALALLYGPLDRRHEALADGATQRAQIGKFRITGQVSNPGVPIIDLRVCESGETLFRAWVGRDGAEANSGISHCIFHLEPDRNGWRQRFLLHPTPFDRTVLRDLS